MSRLIYLHDGSYEGLLNSVAKAVKEPRKVDDIYACKKYQPSLFDTVVQLDTDAEQAGRLHSYLATVHSRCIQFAVNGYLSEDNEVGTRLYHFVHLCLRHGKKAVDLHSNASVRALDDLCRRVSFEAHRLNGLIRFRILADELQYAPFESDHNVIGFCALHFRKRFANRRWILHDVGRDIALHWDSQKLRPVEIDRAFFDQVCRDSEIPAGELTDQELHYQNLWRSFHNSIANPERENSLLQRQFMPRRYWKYLVEMKI